jgi:hypothetical protein
MRLGNDLARQPRSFRSFVDHTSRYWLELRRELGISRSARSAQDIRDIHAFIGAAASAYASAPLSCAELTYRGREECLAVASFARLISSDTALAALLGRHAVSSRTLPENAVAAFKQGYVAARELSTGAETVKAAQAHA